MPKTNSAQLADISALLNTRPEEKGLDGLKGRDEPRATDEVGGESKSGDVLEGVIAILDSLDEWQKSREGETT